jgi:hypothetical protein
LRDKASLFTRTRQPSQGGNDIEIATHVLNHDPLPWLIAQEGLPALRARRRLGLHREGDAEAVRALEAQLAAEQRTDGSFEDSPIVTAGVLNLLDDLQATHSDRTVARGASFLFSVLRSQPGYGRAAGILPGSLETPCDLGGFFGPYENRSQPEVMAWGAREMNAYRQYEPLFGPKSPVREAPRSSRDRAGPSSCYAWGLIPLSYTVEALCRAGYAHDKRLQPAVRALLGAQRESGGWCRNPGGHPTCTLHAIRALGAHSELRQSEYAERTLRLMRAVQHGARHGTSRWWSGSNLFAALQAIAAFDLPLARQILGDALGTIAPYQRKDGTFGTPCPVERVAAVLLALRTCACFKVSSSNTSSY